MSEDCAGCADLSIEVTRLRRILVAYMTKAPATYRTQTCDAHSPGGDLRCTHAPHDDSAGHIWVGFDDRREDSTC